MKTAIILLATLLLFACEQGAKSPRGFSLPEGNAEQGYLVLKNISAKIAIELLAKAKMTAPNTCWLNLYR